MHIPDGYLGPQTFLPAWGVMVAAWGIGMHRVRNRLRSGMVPLLALSAAFCFVIMMFNIPVPGGTTGHAVGAVLAAILLGPWAAMLAVSLALILQAMLFGDGGITAIGANCLTMAVVMPFTGWGVYRLLAGRAPTPRRQWLAGAAAGYLGLNAAALLTAVLFGLQPILAHDAAGRPLYCPFGLGIAVPAMMLEHLLFFGWVEAAVTSAALAWLRRVEPALLTAPATEPAAAGRPVAPRWHRLAWGIVVLALLSPLGLWLPMRFHAGAAWGEWSAEEIGQQLHRTPAGLERLEALWSAPMPDYTLPGQEDAPLHRLSLHYVLAGLLGVGAAAALTTGLAKLLLHPRQKPLPKKTGTLA
jgi:cobalt/nickel transport system permease protein